MQRIHGKFSCKDYNTFSLGIEFGYFFGNFDKKMKILIIILSENVNVIIPSHNKVVEGI